MSRAADDDYAKNQRRIRSAQPKVSSEKAHARAHRAIAANAQQEELTLPPTPKGTPPPSSPGRGGKSSTGRKGTGG